MSPRPSRIAIATDGRFHVLDLARELAKLGHEVRFYSMLTDKRVSSFGLDRRSARSLFSKLAPFGAWGRLAPRLAPGLRERAIFAGVNRWVSHALEPCDVFIGMSGMILEAAEDARRRFDALVYLERGSEHILVQRAILTASGDVGPSDYAVQREIAGYKTADRIVIASPHVADKFSNDHTIQAKLFVNRYGVDLTMFPQRESVNTGQPTMVFAGGWVRRKGVDVLVPLLNRIPELHLIHCGTAPSADLPNHPRMRSLGSVDQRELGAIYRAADLLISPSREEGFPLVRIQALASGIPIICSHDTGAQGLAETPTLATWIDAIDISNLDAMEAAIRKRIGERRTWVPLPDEDRERLSWAGYGRRYSARITSDLKRHAAGLPLLPLR